MGVPTPQEAAPAYDDVFADHPVNQHTPSGSTSAYASVPQDDVELQAHEHAHSHTPPSTVPTAEPESLVQTLAGVFRPKPHVHCEQCDVQTAARQRRENDRHCCNMVAATFMTLFVCGMLLGIVITANVMGKRNRHHD